MTQFTDALREAIKAAKAGAPSATQVETWIIALRNALLASTPSDAAVDTGVRRALEAFAKRAASKTRIKRTQRGVDIGRFTIDRIAPEFRDDLDRKILESVNLIKLDRDRAVAETLQRFQGWLSSVPLSGADEPTRKIAAHIAQPATRSRFEVHRVETDQGHKLMAAISETIAQQTKAIAGIWHDHGVVDKSYHARPEHVARSGKVFLLKKSWARDMGLVKPGAAGFYEDLPDKAAQLPFCRCWLEFLHDLDDLPPDMLTVKGTKALERASA